MWKLLQVFGRLLACDGKRWIIYCFDSFKLKAILTNSGPFMALICFSFEKCHRRMGNVRPHPIPSLAMVCWCDLRVLVSIPSRHQHLEGGLGWWRSGLVASGSSQHRNLCGSAPPPPVEVTDGTCYLRDLRYLNLCLYCVLVPYCHIATNLA